MAEMFGLLKELTTSRTPEKVLVREEARHSIIKNVNAISLVKMKKERNIENNKAVNKNVVELTELNTIKPKEEVDMKKEVGDETNDELVRYMVEKITRDGIKELVEMPRSQPVGYYLKHAINEKLIKCLIGNQRYNDSLLATHLGKMDYETYNLLPVGPLYNAILQKKITNKEDIGGNFLIPCNIGGLKYIDSFFEQGSDVNIMHFSIYNSTWMEFEGNTRDLGSFGEETDEITTLHQSRRRKGHTDARDDVTVTCDGSAVTEPMDFIEPHDLLGVVSILKAFIFETDKAMLGIKCSKLFLLLGVKTKGRERESYKKVPKVKEPAPKGMIAIDGIRWDWTYMAEEDEASKNHALVVDEEEVPTKYALMAKSSSSSNNETLGSQKLDKDKKGVGFNEHCAVTPPLAQVYLPPKKDLSWMGLPEFVEFVADTDRNDTQKIMRFNEIHRFSDDTLQRIEEALYYKVKEFKGIPQDNIDDKGYWDSGSSRHMTENISYLSEYEPFNGGYMCHLVMEEGRLLGVMGFDLVEQDKSSRSGNDAHADDVDIKPIYDEEPMAEEAQKRRDSPRTPFGSPPPQPPPPPLPLGASGAPDDEDTRNDHIHEVKLKQGWWNPRTEDERPTTPKPAWTIPSSNLQDAENKWATALVFTYAPPTENSLLAKTGDIALFMDWYCKRRGITKPTQKDLEGLSYELVKVFHLNVFHLQL
nr:hypothetical protein [Tanacetum cinerariifolium]